MQAAAVISDQLISEVDERSYRNVLAPKVAGTVYLVEALRGQPLEFLTWYSSIGSVVGLPGQASYAAANAFLDMFAASLRRQGMPALSINWCGWDDTGLARTPGGRRAIAELALLGIKSLGSRQATALLDQALGSRAAQLVAIPLNVELRDSSGTHGMDPLIDDLLWRYRNDRTVARRATSTPAAQSALEGLRGPALVKELERLVTTELADLLDIDRARVDLERSLGDMGMDSLLGLEFRKSMQKQCGIVLSATLVWNYPTARAIVTHIAQRFDAAKGDDAPPAATQSATKGEEPLLSDIESLSDEEALRHLTGRG